MVNNQSNPDYWASVGLASLIFGIFSFAVSIIGGYLIINSEASGSLAMTVAQSIMGLMSCLISAFGGLLAVWHYIKTYDLNITLGTGALIGFLTGAGIIAVSTVFQEVWSLVDPEFTSKMIQSMINNIEAMELPDQQKQQMIDSMAAQRDTGILSSLLWGVPIYGILNLITGMIGVSVFGRKTEI
ncbi:MAG: DUF4199 domain-containing protein [Balneolaceae bacterium]|nr:DUF4199 domain-containing protein [Balneolaceae bacterium]